ncbi:MAG TPA: hypothetical protein DEQ98_05625 [Acidobacteria bacterium]|nr:hypothetical protein [Acidobacteriota bacterium]
MALALSSRSVLTSENSGRTSNAVNKLAHWAEHGYSQQVAASQHPTPVQVPRRSAHRPTASQTKNKDDSSFER